MNKVIFLWMISIVFVLELFAKDEIHFGVYAYRGYEDTKKRYEPLVKHLNETLHKKVVLEVLSQDEMNKKIAAKELDIVTTSPIHFLLLRHDHKLSGAIATLVAMYEDDIHTNKFAGVIVVQNNSPIKTLGDIKNKIIATPNINLLGGFRAQAYELHKIGIDVLKNSKEIKELKSGYKNVIKDVFEGRSDVGFTRDGIVEQMIKEGELKEGEIRIINEKTHPKYPFKTSTPLYPEWPIFALPHADEDEVKDFVSALFLLKPTSEYAKESKIYGYSPAVDYLETEELTRELRLPPFDKAPQITLNDIWNKYKYSLILAVAAFFIVIFFYIEAQRKKMFAESLLKNMGEGVYGVDESGNCTWINQRALDMLGFKKEEVLHKNQHTMFHHHTPSNEIYNAYDCPITKTIHDGINRDAEEFFIRKDGSFFPVELSVAAIQNNGAIVIFRDITQKRAFDEAILQEKQKAEEANSAKSEFLANMSHEIRTPMNAILGLNEMMFDTNLNQRQKELVIKVKNASKMLLGIINDILDYSKMEAKKLVVEYKVFEIEAVLSQLRVLFGTNALNKDLELYFHIKKGVPCEVVLDELRLTQVLTNLLSNALKFTHKGSVILEISLVEKVNDTQAKLLFSLSDTGIGMSEEEISKLFTPFMQADASTTRKYGGTGLGLSISKRIVEAFGSEFYVKSQKEVGTKFSFELLLEVASWECKDEIESENLKRVLIVDDHKLSREILKDILSRFDCLCDEADNAKDALGMIKEADKQDNAYKIILMDYEMPELNGIDAIKEIYRLIQNGELTSKTPTILMLSAHAKEKINFKDVKVDSFLTKPVTSSTLFDAFLNAKHSIIRNVKHKVQELSSFGGLHVLLVEDNKLNQEVASLMLNRVGVEVDIAQNGKEGVTKYLLNQKKYGIVFMDLHMPVMNGYDAASLIRQKDSEIPIVALSAAILAEDIQKAKSVGMNEHISKPIDINELYKILAKYANNLSPYSHFTSQERNSEILDTNYLKKTLSSQNLVYKVLNRFMHELENEFSDIARLDGGIKTLSHKLHTLKGVSGSIGANELFGICKELEAKIKTKEPILQSDKESISLSIKSLKKSISEYLNNSGLSIQKMDKEDFKLFVEEVKKSLLVGSVLIPEKQVTFLGNIKEYLNTNEYILLEEALDDFDYEKTLEILNKCEF